MDDTYSYKVIFLSDDSSTADEGVILTDLPTTEGCWIEDRVIYAEGVDRSYKLLPPDSSTTSGTA